MTLEKTIRDLNNKLMDNGRQPNMSLIGDRLDEGGMLNIDKARKLPDNIQDQIMKAKKEYDSTWSGVFVPMGKEGSTQRKEYERRGKVFKAASAKYKALLMKHKVMSN
tara:strand:- start:359 stop:682 length:324 start_codon:yes stop_codon:yes gene_type:complete